MKRHTPPTLDGPIVELATAATVAVCREFNVWPWQIARGQRTAPVCLARHMIAEILRLFVYIDERRTPARIAYVDIGAQTPDGFGQLSTPRVAAILGCDHSALITGLHAGIPDEPMRRALANFRRLAGAMLEEVRP
jgi:hypothetical protein